MRIFISYKFTKENPEQVKEKLIAVDKIIKDLGHTPFTLWKDVYKFSLKDEDYKDPLIGALKELNGCDCILVLADSANKSEGQLIEVGYAKALNKKIIVALKHLDHTWALKEIANKLILFKDMNDLKNKLKKALEK